MQLTPSTIKIDTAVTTIQQLLSSGKLDRSRAISGYQLSRYSRHEGERKVCAIITSLLLEIQSTYNIKGGISEAQAADISATILKDFWYLKLAELFLFAEKAKNGEFGKVYDRLDRAVIFEWLRAYDAMREDYAFPELSATDDTQAGYSTTEDRQKVDAAFRELADAFRPKQTQTLREKLSEPEFEKFRLEYEKGKIDSNASKNDRQGNIPSDGI